MKTPGKEMQMLFFSCSITIHSQTISIVLIDAFLRVFYSVFLRDFDSSCLCFLVKHYSKLKYNAIGFNIFAEHAATHGKKEKGATNNRQCNVLGHV